jgi:hypothetical protein
LSTQNGIFKLQSLAILQLAPLSGFLALVAGQKSFTQRSNAGCINSKGNRAECKDGCNGIWQASMLVFFVLVVLVAQSARSLSKCQICKCNNQREHAKVGDWRV